MSDKCAEGKKKKNHSFDTKNTNDKKNKRQKSF